MDVRMPVMDGLEATRAIRARECETCASRLPVIALTAHAIKGDEIRCREAGMDGYITEPVQPAACSKRWKAMPSLRLPLPVNRRTLKVSRNALTGEDRCWIETGGRGLSSWSRPSGGRPRMRASCTM